MSLLLLFGSPAVEEDIPSAVVSDAPYDEPNRAFNWVECIPTAVIAAVATSILALTAGYLEPAEAEELDSQAIQVIEDVQSDYISQVWTDPDADEPVESYSSALLLLEQPPEPPQPDFIVQVSTDVEPDEPIAIYGSALFLLDQPAAGDLTQIPLPAILDPEPEDDPPDTYLSLYFDDVREVTLTIEFPDENDDTDVFALDTALGLVYEDAPVPPPVVVQYDFVEIRSFTERRRFR